MKLRRGAISLLAAAVLGLALPAIAGAKTLKAHFGQVSATVSYNGPDYQPKDLTLTIVREGKTVVNKQPITYNGCGGYCLVPDIRVADVVGHDEPAVIVDLFTGGAHCCSIAQVYQYNARKGTYVKYSQYFGNSGYELKQASYGYVFITNDDRFYYEFSSFAASGAPIQIFRFTGARFTVVTKSFPGMIKRDASEWWKTYESAITSKSIETDGLFTAWAADQELLGHDTLVRARLASENRAHHLRSDFISRASFPKALLQFLRKTGYITR